MVSFEDLWVKTFGRCLARLVGVAWNRTVCMIGHDEIPSKVAILEDWSR